ncbi:transcription factor IIFalpha isoform X2 [Rhynchophorus ferrugineus]|uniref:Transcription initiation factor IIF subunit alpha n=1 Tax=Rhynchophorus ferrugineus TaxID=354439 RepID=A0A834IX65_RHYFE|nr:hypothetical protein GWI33_004351 [Rhynchophorus ferrugineus]
MATSSNVSVQEFSIRVPKNVQRKYHVMRFNGTLGVDFGKWTQVKMERENNLKEYKGIEEEQPKFGAGSEFGREAKEEARRKKLGIVAKKYRADDQPWILKSYGSTVKKFKGIREGGVSENAAYYVFTHAEDGGIEAFPLHEWYKFQPNQRYKTLSAEEAELEFNRRNKHLNYFSLMLRKRLKGEEDTELDEEGEKSKKTSKKDRELKISDMDEWIDSSEGDSDSEKEDKGEDEDDEGKSKKKKKGKNAGKKPKKKRDTDVEAIEDSDDGDEEGREVDYISDSSESEPENANLDGVAEEKGLKKLLNSDEEESEDSDKEDKDKSNEDEEKEGEEGEKKPEEDKDKKKKKKDKKKDSKKKKENDPDDDFSSDSSTDEDKKKKVDKKEKGKKEEKVEPSSGNSSRSATPTIDNKRKIVTDALAGPSKKAKLDIPNFIPGLAESNITEDAVRKYLMRKPMTTTELLQKFKSKKTGLSSEQLVNVMTQILKKINPIKQTLKGKMYLSIKPT